MNIIFLYFLFLQENTHNYWFDSLRWFVGSDKYAKKFPGDRSINLYLASPSFLDGFTPPQFGIQYRRSKSDNPLNHSFLSLLVMLDTLDRRDKSMTSPSCSVQGHHSQKPFYSLFPPFSHIIASRSMVHKSYSKYSIANISKAIFFF